MPYEQTKNGFIHLVRPFFSPVRFSYILLSFLIWKARFDSKLLLFQPNKFAISKYGKLIARANIWMNVFSIQFFLLCAGEMLWKYTINANYIIGCAAAAMKAKMFNKLKICVIAHFSISMKS